MIHMMQWSKSSEKYQGEFYIDYATNFVINEY